MTVDNYPMVIRTEPSITLSPGFTVIEVTVPAYSLSMLFCIFIASSTSTTSPCFTVSPTFTLTSVIVPGSGALIAEPVPAGAGLSAAGAAAGAARLAATATGFAGRAAFGAAAGLMTGIANIWNPVGWALLAGTIGYFLATSGRRFTWSRW